MLVNSANQIARHHFLLAPLPPYILQNQNHHQLSPPPHDVGQEEFNLRNDIMNDA